jgi:threonine aldolase
MIDLRSDTVTRPSEAMRAAMASAPVGDDVFGDDPTVIRLEERVAELLGKEAAVYVPSGTMANQIALRVHTRSGDRVVMDGESHIRVHESGAPAALAGVTIVPLDTARGAITRPPPGSLRPNNARHDGEHPQRSGRDRVVP